GSGAEVVELWLRRENCIARGEHKGITRRPLDSHQLASRRGKSFDRKLMLASVCWSSTSRNAFNAVPRTPCSLQRRVITHWLPLAKHSTSAKSGSVARTTSPSTVSAGG